ncbi:protein HIDE1 [Cebus imitator]|uniref:protein HIDE1 n=1 Tax=Cebus imitator TaxID=2715852 RepID=UPI000809B11F|nr:protein HIDE1 [Cebus imitator]XP_017355446.1 protein HIDE1 [Cebus imitator]XP_037584317.1 protein HIDE1 [Cebus imitator]
MPWTILLFAAGSLAIPPPSIRLVPPYPSSQEDPIHISCMAPGDFPGANFTLYRGGQVVQLLQAPANQRGVTFNLSGGSSEAPGGPFHCQYGVIGEHNQPQLSDLSEPVNISFPGKVLLWDLTARSFISSHGPLVCTVCLEAFPKRARLIPCQDLLVFPFPYSQPAQKGTELKSVNKSDFRYG